MKKKLDQQSCLLLNPKRDAESLTRLSKCILDKRVSVPVLWKVPNTGSVELLHCSSLSKSWCSSNEKEIYDIFKRNKSLLKIYIVVVLLSASCLAHSSATYIYMGTWTIHLFGLVIIPNWYWNIKSDHKWQFAQLHTVKGPWADAKITWSIHHTTTPTQRPKTNPQQHV